MAFARDCEEFEVVFAGAATTLDPTALSTLDALANRMKERGASGALMVFVFGDDQAPAAEGLHRPRLEAVRAALIERGVPEGNVVAPGSTVHSTPLTPEAWVQHTGVSHPPSMSGMVKMDC